MLTTKTTTTKTKMISGALALALCGLSATARASDAAGAGPAGEARADIQKTLGFVPQFFLKMPELALPGAWEEMKGLQLNPSTALPGRAKELIGLAVAAQIPCHYCIIAHTEFAKLNGANAEEIGDAVAMAALTRHWSTVLNGTQTDEAQFRAEIAKLVANAKQAAASHAAPPKPGVVTDGASAVKDMTQMLGFAPEFLKKFPEAGRAGAWREFRDVQLNPGTALSPKYKELAGLAVASQIPCKFCVIAHTEFAKLAGASDGEINEAIGMAALTRNLSTMMNGLQVDEAQFKRDIDKLVKNATAGKKQQTTAKR
jgi:AhpD family alkylhydroperoxidase